MTLDDMMQDESFRDYLGDAYAAYKVGDFDYAIEVLGKALERQPEFALGYVLRGTCHAALEQWQDAVENFQQAVQLEPENVSSLVHMATMQNYLKQWDAALANFEKVLTMDAQNEMAFSGRAWTHYHQGRYEQSLTDYSEALRLKPEDAHSLSGRGEVLCVLGRYDEAMVDFQQANKIRPGAPDLHAVIALVRHMQGEVEDARRMWKLLIQAVDERYGDADWAGEELNWAPPLIDELRKLIAGLS